MLLDRGSNLVFLENQAQVFWVKHSMQLDSKTKLVAITADALQMLEECDLPHEAVSAYADSRKLISVEEEINKITFDVCQEIESFIAHQEARVQFDGPGFLSGQGYGIQHSVSAIATRSFLMREVISACSPEVVTVFEGNVDSWFLGDGYTRNPWLDVVEGLATEYGFHYQSIPEPSSKIKSSKIKTSKIKSSVLPSFGSRLHSFVVRVRGAVWRRVARLLKRRNLDDPAALAGLRLLVVHSTGYDWGPVLDTLSAINGVECTFLAVTSPHRGSMSRQIYDPQLRTCSGHILHELKASSPEPNDQETQQLGELFDAWLSEHPTAPELRVLDMDLFPALTTHLRATTQFSPALAKHADSVAIEALKATTPHVVCFFAIATLAHKRFAFQCQQRQIPVVCYQHGAGYNWKVLAKDEQIETAHADYFLTYGPSVQPRPNAAFPVRAKYISVGSARIEQMIVSSKPSQSVLKNSQIINVLWIAESSTMNTLGNTAGQVEDTKRYLLQKRCLEILGRANNVRVTYRPYQGNMHIEGTWHWLQRTKFSSIRTNASQPLEELIRSSDVVIADLASGTTWAEVIGLKKPLILYCDPDQVPLAPDFIPDLERACYWCKSEDALVAAVRRLLIERETFVAELQQIDTAAFLRDHVLHREDGLCLQRVVSFLNNVCRNKQSVDEWQESSQL